MYKILLIGPQGSGKGTQAELLAERMGVPAFAMGQLLRDVVATGSELGKTIDQIITGGNLVSDELAAEVLKARLAQPDTQNGYILDGYPRNLAQYGAFNFDVPTHVVVIEVPREESLTRLSGRLTCDQCGKVYAAADGFKVGDACPACGKGELMQRTDDTPEAINRRLEIYENDTRPVVEKFAEKGLVRHVDGVGSVQEVSDRIAQAIGV